MRIFWRVLGGAGLFVGLVLIAVAIAVRTIDVRQFIGPIEQRVKKETGRDLVIGAIDLEMSLEPKLVLSDASIANAPWGEAPRMITARRVEAQVALLPLLGRRFEIVRFKLIEPTIALEVDAQGHRNWDLESRPVALPSALPGALPVAALAGGLAIRGLGIGDVEVSSGTLTYRDRSTGKSTDVAIESLTLRARDAQTPVIAEFRGRVDDLSVSLRGNLGPVSALVERRWPYPIALDGEIGGNRTAVSMKVRADGPSLGLDETEFLYRGTTWRGRIVFDYAGPRPRVTFKLATAALALGGSGAAAAGAGAAGAATLFSDAPLNFAFLAAIDADGEITIDRASFPGGAAVDGVSARVTLTRGHLEAPDIRVASLGGSIRLRADFDAAGGEPVARVRASANSLELGAVLAAAGAQQEVHGGRTDVTIDLTGRGVSARQWARRATGSVVAVVGPATISSSPDALDGAVAQLANALKGPAGVAPAIELQCAVLRLPFSQGIARIDRSIAIESSVAGVSASGTLDLEHETLDFGFRPRLKADFPVDLAAIAGLFRLRGPLSAPAVEVEPSATRALMGELAAGLTSGATAFGAPQGPASRGSTAAEGECLHALGGRGGIDARHLAEAGVGPYAVGDPLAGLREVSVAR